MTQAEATLLVKQRWPGYMVKLQEKDGQCTAKVRPSWFFPWRVVGEARNWDDVASQSATTAAAERRRA